MGTSTQPSVYVVIVLLYQLKYADAVSSGVI